MLWKKFWSRVDAAQGMPAPLERQPSKLTAEGKPDVGIAQRNPIKNNGVSFANLRQPAGWHESGTVIGDKGNHDSIKKYRTQLQNGCRTNLGATPH